MNKRVRRMILGGITGAAVCACLDLVRSRFTDLHMGWRMLIAGAAAYVIFSALDALSKLYAVKASDKN